MPARPIEGLDDARAPGYDGPGGITARLANRVVLELLNGMAQQATA